MTVRLNHSGFSLAGKWIMQGFVFVRTLPTECNANCFFGKRKVLIRTKLDRKAILLVRNAG